MLIEILVRPYFFEIYPLYLNDGAVVECFLRKVIINHINLELLFTFLKGQNHIVLPKATVCCC